MTFQRENRYIVIKRKDLDAAAAEGAVDASFAEVLDVICDNLPTRECLVIESDWPEYEPAWRMIQARVEGATLSPAHIEDEREACERWIRQQIGMPARIPMDWDGPFNRYTWAAWSARAALSAPPAADDMCNADNPASRCECREEFGHRVCAAPPAAGVPEDEWIDPVALSSCGPAYDSGWRDGVSEAKRLNSRSAPTPPASEQQRAVVMPERSGDLNHHERYRAGWNACVAEFLRLNPHLAKGEGV